MRRSALCSLAGVLALTMLAGLTGCTSSSDVTQPTSPAVVQSEVRAIAPAMSVAGPSSEAAGNLMASLLGQLGTAPLRSGAAALPTPPTCPATFDLGNGVTGTCSVSDQGVVTFIFSGTLTIDGAAVSVNGALVATPTATQPATGSSYSLAFNAQAAGQRGTATWTATGTVTLDAAYQVVDYNLTMTHTITPNGGGTAVVTVVLRPGLFELTATGPLGRTLKFVLNQETMTGVIMLNGQVVAQLTITNGCANVDYVDPALTDEQFCPGAN